MTEKEKSSVIGRYRSKVRDEHKRFIKKNLEISNQISGILEKKGMTQKDLAELLEKHESEISKLMSGLHNLTLKSITRIETVLGEDIILTPDEACRKYSNTEYVILKVSANKNDRESFRTNFTRCEFLDHGKKGKIA
ncbi:MAG: helix-turn-helix domain-containing protein [Bacteroidota bacterium]